MASNAYFIQGIVDTTYRPIEESWKSMACFLGMQRGVYLLPTGGIERSSKVQYDQELLMPAMQYKTCEIPGVSNSTSDPCCRSAMRSKRSICRNRYTTAITVCAAHSGSIISSIRASVSQSTLLVASSKMRSGLEVVPEPAPTVASRRMTSSAHRWSRPAPCFQELVPRGPLSGLPPRSALLRGCLCG